MGRHACFAVILAALIAWSESDVSAWGDEGHKIVCGIAYKLLTPSIRTKVDDLVHSFRTPEKFRYQFFTTGCVFADLARRKAQDKVPGWGGYAPFERFHFLNVARTTKSVPASACGGDCVLEGIQRHSDALGNTALTKPARGEALLLLGHWVGDIHQPLHVSYRDDLGGNEIKLTTSSIYASDHLHGVWDSGIAARAHGTTDWWTYAGQLHAAITPAMRSDWADDPPLSWAQQSYDVTITEGVRYCRWQSAECRSIPGKRTLTSSYQTAFEATVETRLQQAGVRLAALITRALTP
jgi:hypothetical protein